MTGIHICIPVHQIGSCRNAQSILTSESDSGNKKTSIDDSVGMLEVSMWTENKQANPKQTEDFASRYLEYLEWMESKPAGVFIVSGIVLCTHCSQISLCTGDASCRWMRFDLLD